MTKKKAATKKATAKRGPGRPKGAKNRPKAPVVDDSPPACPSCACTETVDAGKRTRKSISVKGFSVHWRSMVCAACGQRWIRRRKRKPPMDDLADDKASSPEDLPPPGVSGVSA